MSRKRFIEEVPFEGAPGKVTAYGRLGRIESVDYKNFKMDITWMDGYGGRTQVDITQSDFGSISMPLKNTLALFQPLRGGIFYELVRFIPFGLANRVEKKDLPEIKEGEKIFESYASIPGKAGEPVRTGTKFYMNNKGDVVITTPLGDVWKISRDDSLIFQRSMDWTVETEAMRLKSGILRRTIAGIEAIITKNNIPILVGGKPLTEHKTEVVETSDLRPGLGDTGTPLIETTLGTIVNSLGVAETSGEGNEICIRLKTSDSTGLVDGVKCDVDKDGNIEVKLKGSCDVEFVRGVTGIKKALFKIDSSGNVTLGSDVAETLVKALSKATIEAVLINIGKDATFKPLLYELFGVIYNNHFHVAQGTPTSGPTPPAGSVTASSTVSIQP